MAAGQAGAALHTMAILQAYKAQVLKEMDEGDRLTPEAVKELRRATDLGLRATKYTVWAYLATQLTLSSISSGLQKCSQLSLSSSCHVVHANRPLPLPCVLYIFPMRKTMQR